MNQDTPAGQQEPRTPHHEGSLRETLESIIIAFVLAFMFRAFIVEAFIIPTGSMAPTLLGAHFRADCPMCGYSFTINATDHQRRPEVDCAMCDYDINLGVRGAMQESGDRILVLKYVYEFSEPRRWETVVFKNPEDPDQNYIKRLVGLPEEELWLVRGNVFTRPLDTDGESTGDGDAWRIQRKPYDIQRAVWVPMYHSRYYPLDGGSPGAEGPLETYSPRSEPWQVPWQPTGETRADWGFDRHGPRWRYEGDAPGVLDFAFTRKHLFNYYAYNALARQPHPYTEDPVKDMRVGATLMPEEPGLAVTLRVSSQRRQFRGTIDGDGRVTLEARPVVNAVEEPAPWETVAEAETAALPAGRGTRLELWHADQRLSMWADGRLLAEWTYEEHPQTLLDRERRVVEPVVRIEVDGPAVTLREVNLDRDVYYTDGDNAWARGAAEPTIIAADHFYCLGDNSPFSKDSRLWTQVDIWLQDLTGVPVGYVPREMMIGRAFFVYWPAMWRFREGGMAVIPNFADMRFIR